ncbi:hypothetical protein QR680_007800 [Steinernema hermaphroditum]|uniref:ZP domain-containing protein n=1 Tax=Steinernema hermaphroditum TaxID=289476 RepID=A0AA39IEA1_9BILA|nr:hypothetical protein QR680_007800 [Steinernema hermaphroditum]
MLPFFFSLILILPPLTSSSLFCPFTKEPDDPGSYNNYRIQSFPAPASSSSPPLYKLIPAQSQATEGIRFLNAEKTKSCTEACIVELHGFISTREDTVMYQTSPMQPGNYEKINNTKMTRMFCAALKDDCGATMPIYRHFRFGPQGLHHAYGFSSTEKIDKFTLEPSPLCYGWKSQAVATPSPSKCDSTLPSLDSVRPLNVYDNSAPGLQRDHFYSAALPNDFLKTPLLSPFRDYRYKMLDDLGMVVVEPRASACNCLVKLVQVFDKQDGLFGRRDHKLIIAGEEQNRPYEHYEPTGEVVYCAAEEGACGATLPLRKYFDLTAMDTVYTVNNTVAPAMSQPYPEKVLCWIWDVDKIAPIARPTSERKPRVVSTSTPAPGCSCTCPTESHMKVDKKPYFEQNQKQLGATVRQKDVPLESQSRQKSTAVPDSFPTPHPLPTVSERHRSKAKLSGKEEVLDADLRNQLGSLPDCVDFVRYLLLHPEETDSLRARQRSNISKKM